MRRGVAIAAMIALAGCSGPPRIAPPDFCKARGMRIPNSERVPLVLVNVLQREARFIERFGPDGVHWFAWRRDYLKRHPKAADLDIAKLYYQTFPNCCDVTPPGYLDPKKVNDNEWDNIFDGIGDTWAADVYIWRKVPAREQERVDARIARVVSACNDTIRYYGGLGAKIE